jgi:hypothetical protein
MKSKKSLKIRFKESNCHDATLAGTARDSRLRPASLTCFPSGQIRVERSDRVPYNLEKILLQRAIKTSFISDIIYRPSRFRKFCYIIKKHN